MRNQRHQNTTPRKKGGSQDDSRGSSSSSMGVGNGNGGILHPTILGYGTGTVQDPLHNGSTPVCRILNDAIADVFPELSAAAAAADVDVDADANVNAGPNRKPQQQTQPTTGLSGGSSSSSSLGQMIRRKYLWMRLASRMASASTMNSSDIDHLFQGNHGSHSNGSGNANANANANANGANKPGGAAKKKRKRKKKKKGKGSQSVVAPAEASLPSAIMAPGVDDPGAESEPEEFAPLRGNGNDNGNGNDDNGGDGDKNSDYENKSMMSAEDHSLEALDEAVKIETEKMIQEEANYKRPSLSAFPSDDNFQAEECPSQFIDQIRPEAEDSPEKEEEEPHRPCHLLPSSSSDARPTGSPSLPEDVGSNDEDDNDVLWMNPLSLTFLVSFGAKNNDADPGNTTRGSGGGDATIGECKRAPSQHEATRSLLFEWIDQSLVPDDDPRDDNGLSLGPGEASANANTNANTNAKQQQHQHNLDTEGGEIRREWDSFLEFCNNQHASGTKPGIAVRDLKEIGASIGCRTCRIDALSELEAIAAKSVGAAPSSSSAAAAARSPRVVMKPSFLEKPPPPTEPDVDVDAAFDYVALEEGNHVPKPTGEAGDEPPDEYDCDCADGGTLGSSLAFLTADVAMDAKPKRSATTGKSGSKKAAPTTQSGASEQYLFLQGPTTEQLDGFLTEWLVAGVDEDRLVQLSVRKESAESSKVNGNGNGKSKNNNNNNNSDNSNGDQAGSLVVTSADELETIQKTVEEIQLLDTTSLDRMITELREMKIPPIEKNVDLTGIPFMENCEEQCDEVLTTTILPIITGELSVASHVGADLQIRFWTNYLRVLETTLKAADKYYQRLHEDIADQNGTLAFFFVSKPFRSLYRTLAEEKIKALSTVGTQFLNDLNSPAMREFYTRHVWQQRQTDEEHQDTRSTRLDEKCRDLLFALTRWTKIIVARKMSDVNDERRKRLMTVFELLQAVGELLRSDYEAVERFFSKESQGYFSWLLSNIHLAHGVKRRMRLIEMDDVVSLTIGILLMWRHVRIMQSRVARSHSSQRLPLCLHRWMRQEPTSVEQAFQDRFHFNPKCWHGTGGGRRRVMGISAGLTYACLQQRCNEWKAEIARQELLTSFDDDDVSTLVTKTGGPGSKSSKKNKKKNKGTALTPVNGSGSKPAGKSGNNAAESNNNKKEMSRGKNEHERGETNGISLQNNGTQVNIDGDDVGESTHFGSESWDGTEDCESMVVVQDDCGSVIPAMDFLADRLAELMKQTEDDNVWIVPS